MKNKKIGFTKQKEAKFRAIRNGICSMHLKNYSEYEKVRKIQKLPSRPEREFLEYGWKGWIDFLGLENQETKDQKFVRIKEEIKEANIENYSEYEMVRNEHDWPARPEREFLEYGWKGWEDFFGRKLPERKIRSTKESRILFNSLKKQVVKLGIQKQEDYKSESKTHANWPVNLNVYYEYTTFSDFVGKTIHYVSLGQLRKEVRKHHIAAIYRYKNVRREKKFFNWPADPEKHYQDKWKGWEDLIGKKLSSQTRIKTEEILPYEILKYFVQMAGVKTYQQYHEERKKHVGWVSNPYRYYTKNGEWKGYFDLFGNK